MPTFSFTQCVAVLFANTPDAEQIEAALERWPLAGNGKAAEGDDGWALSTGGYVLDAADGGYVAVDVVPRRWPDDPEAIAASPGLSSAWSQGAFGPAATPGALARAADQPWLWDGAATAVGDHQAFVRFRTGLVAPEPDSPEAAKAPKRDRAFELSLLTEMAQPFLQKKGALAFFAPAGEALRSREQIDAALRRKVGAGQLPFDLWTNVRAVALSRTPEAGWHCLDVVGMAQLGLPDVDAIFAEGREDPEAVEQLLRNACLHLLSGHTIGPGSTSDDAKGRRWEASHAFALVAPRRPVVRWLPYGRSRASQGLIAKLAAETPPR